MNHPGMREEIRALTKRIDGLEAGLNRADAAVSGARVAAVMIHREQAAFAKLVRARFEALHRAINEPRPLGLKRRLRKLVLPITPTEIRAEIERITREIEAAQEAASTNARLKEEARARAAAEKAWSKGAATAPRSIQASSAK